MGDLVRKTKVSDFTDKDFLLFSKEKKVWIRFVENDETTISVFQGKGDETRQTWTHKFILNRSTIRQFWNNCVDLGYVKVVLN